MELHELSLAQLHDMLSSGEVSSEHLVKHFENRIAEHNGELNAFLGAEVTRPVDNDSVSSPIAGIPFAVKDNIVLTGRESTSSSKVLQGYKSPYTATALQKLMQAGGVVLGRTNCDEFGMGSSTENSAYGPTRNPWDLERVPGGSSGGSAAAVAAGLIPYALGSDTGGSVRQPAGLCGVVGLKPTYGRVSRYGLMALASSFDCIGPFTKTVADSALVMNYLAGPDSMDATALSAEVPDYTTYLNKGIKGLRVGVPKEYFGEGLSEGVAKTVKEAIAKLEGLGAIIVEVSLPNSHYALPAYYVIQAVEISANLSRYDGVRYPRRAEGTKTLSDIYFETRGQGFGPEVKRRLVLGTFASSSGYYDAYYKQALRAQNLIKQDFKNVFSEVDILATPISPTIAFKLGENSDDPLNMYLNDVYSISANVAGIPAISIPCGFDQDLPVGLQFMAPWLREDTIFQAAGAYEEATDWHTERPQKWFKK